MDKYDQKLLKVLQQDARASLEQLSYEVGISVPTVQRRVRNLRNSGVITGEVALVDPVKVGQHMTFVIMVELDRERLDHIDAFSRRMQKHDQVQQCYYITGEADFCLICTARDISDFEELTKSLFFKDSNVKRFRTSVVMSRKKVSSAVALTHD
ncbi:Lrp/AsnC family transcriptional regulator [Arenicella sp. 4NH20-0111]|uniref:Lrp/AsnC family transcriptional regulator n=1 Tax=Arenicella sp. 4NH20-0111 TaxID=3127648 RepID=UPI0031079D6E